VTLGLRRPPELGGFADVAEAFAVLARRHRRRGRAGRHETCFTLQESAVPEYDLTGIDREPQGSTIGAAVPSNTFRSRVGRRAVIAPNVDTPCGPVNRISDSFADAQFRAREMLIEVRDPEIGDYVAPTVVPKLSATPGPVEWTGPASGRVQRRGLRLARPRRGRPRRPRARGRGVSHAVS
jgi:crotonobetainyl-CoA:carnitine CoA-transferase CaiB-like acyl-CoA transferase